MINSVMLIAISQGRNVTESKLCHIYFITQHISITMQLQLHASTPKFIPIQYITKLGIFACCC